MTTSVVVATTQLALVAAHADIGTWIQERHRRLSAELEQSQAALATARARHWSTDALSRLVRGLEKHQVFLDKVKGAIEAGYTIVPNFNIDALAVRTDRPTPNYKSFESMPRVGAARLPAGVGEFVSPEPYIESWEIDRPRADGKGTYKVTIYRTTGQAPVDVPFVLMKKDLADALHAAMVERVFDEIGIVRDTPKGDPVLVGRIRHPKTLNRWDNRGVTFFIGWWFDVRALEP